jgi:hypothetical protein
VGLIAREIEALGIPTLCLSSAYSITRAARPPRASFVDFPLGHTSGRPHALDEQAAMMTEALKGFEDITQSGDIKTLPYEWLADHSWKDAVMQPAAPGAAGDGSDFRLPRFETPQYQFEADAEVADVSCPTCVFLT